MGFKQLIDSKKMLSLLAVLMLTGTNMVMAQAAATATEEKPGVDWLSVSYYILLFVLACIAVAVVGKILRVYDLSQKIQGKAGINWNTVMAVLFIGFLLAGLAGVYWSFTVHGNMILPGAASLHGVKIDAMFWTTTSITMVVFVLTQILLFTFVFIYKYSPKRRAYFLPHNNTIEKVWTIAPAIVLTVLVIFGFFTWQEVTNSADAKGEPASINVDITGEQFAWNLRYPGPDGLLGKKNYKLISGANKLGIDFNDKNSLDDLKADTMVIPVNKSVRLNISSKDIIHSVYMPHFRVQLNAVPGLPTFFKFTPTVTTEQMRNKLENPEFEYLVYCNKICGASHYNMQKVVRVVSEAEYAQWLAKQQPYLTPALRTELKLAEVSNNNNSTKRLALNN
ncbi:cytochrome c oxidase subunit II transmembrane domain-containing protein [Mucilaginibacter auburnensis]|uniref:Cytochrome c oxidase subunit 2 n=1 Tax=Mucilaginibacter auburnensis TaxID=1457233 RepID=A0A2H9VSW0_9SPHI|nr:cytochrome c oxidase subunit II transmembrane domain-containing protein [Mucilaginibacter auburnensis]PJJ83905.1 cytochrome c oxidase subunit 2 [Mucilaginibacter auburnensis]